MSDIEIKKGDTWVSKLDETNTVDIEEANNSFVTGVHSKDGDYVASRSDFLHYFKPTKQGRKDDTPKAVQILNEAVAIMAERGKSYDKSGGEAERSMPKIVAMFNALTGHELTPEQGWKFMCCLELARSEQGEYREDNYLDGAAYMALAGEEASEANDD